MEHAIGGRGDQDRRKSVRFHLPERRSGFDRRRRHPVLGRLRDDPLLLGVLLGAFVGFSAADGVLTAYVLDAGIAVEGNPVIAGLLVHSASAAWLFKAALTALVALAVWYGRRYRKVLAVGVLGVIVYSAVVVYHLSGAAYALG